LFNWIIATEIYGESYIFKAIGQYLSRNSIPLPRGKSPWQQKNQQ